MPTPAAPRFKRTLDHAQRLPRPAAGARATLPGDELEALRSLCHELVADLPESQRHLIGVILLHVQGVRDIEHLRVPLFDALARRFGEVVARERVARLDTALGR